MLEKFYDAPLTDVCPINIEGDAEQLPLESDTPAVTWPDHDYQLWLPQWHRLTQDPSTNMVLVPLEACRISTPLKASVWSIYLWTYPYQELAQFFLTGITKGFKIGFNHHTLCLKSAQKNLEGAYSHPEVVQEYLRTKVHMGRVVGPLDNSFKLVTHISRFGVIPKSHQPNKWRFIVDLSHPVRLSVNDSIPKYLSAIQYITIDNAIQGILRLGKGTMLAKIDIQSAFRLLPVHASDRHLLGMSWTDGVYIDTCLPFGLRSVPNCSMLWLIYLRESYSSREYPSYSIISMIFSQWAIHYQTYVSKI